MNQCCGTCKWHSFENISDGWVCVNNDSDYCSDWTEYEDSCEEWGGKGVAMTENETIEIIGNIPIDGKDKCYTIEQYQDAKTKAIEALEEVKQYRSLGTPKECQTAMELYKEMHKRKFTLEAVEEYMKFEDKLVERGLTFSDLIDLMEKNTPKKPKFNGKNWYRCHNGCEVHKKEFEMDRYCPKCGQKIGWEGVR